MEAILKKIIESMEAQIKITEGLVAEIKKTLGEIGTRENDKPKRRAKDKEPVAEPAKDAAEPTPHKDGGALLVKDVTIEMLREMATKYAEVFGMEKLLMLNKKAGSAKLSGIPTEMYGVVYGQMSSDLAAAEALKKEGKPVEKPADDHEKIQAELNAAPNAPALTIEKMREHAAAFLSKNGEPAFKAVLKAFGAEKLSGVPAAKWPAFLEAIDNA